MATRLYVGNLSYDTTQEGLTEAFMQVSPEGTVKVDLVIDKISGRSKGFAFADMANEEEAAKAIQALNNKDLDGRKLVVNEARPKTDAPRGGNGGGFRSNDNRGYAGRRTSW